jgi:transcription termination/antitermination protein NusA
MTEKTQQQVLDIKQAIDLVCSERGISSQEVVEAIEASIAKAYRKDFGEETKGYEAEYDLTTNSYNIFETMTVTDKVDDEGNVFNPDRELTLMAAMLSDHDAFVNKVYKTPIDQEKLVEFGRVATGVAKQSIIQYIRNLKHNKVIEKYKDMEGEMITVEVDYFKKNGYYVKLDQTTVFMGSEDLMPFDKFKPGTLIKAFIETIVEDPKNGYRITLKRNSPGFVCALIKSEVPEVASGQIEIIKAVREAGVRTKLLVQKEDQDSTLDPVGTIIGRKEARILNISRELNINMQERIDVIEYNSEDFESMVFDALEPARIDRIENTETGIICYCAKEEAPMAVGKKGANVRLASKLLDIEISIQTEESAELMGDGSYTVSVD